MPYSKSINEQLEAFIESAGMEVAAFDSFHADNVEELGRISASEVADLSRRTMTADCEAMFIARAQLPTSDILDGLRLEFGRPVLSSVQCLATQIRSIAV